MFTARELRIILNSLEPNYQELLTELIRREETGQEIAYEEGNELSALIDKVRKLFLET